MGSVKDLPGAGHGFRASSGTGNFAKKFNSASRVAGSSLYNLRDNKKAILDVVKKSQGAIRIGHFDRLRQVSAYNKIRKIEGSKLTKDDKKDLKLILKHLGGGDEADEKGEHKIKIEKQIDRDESFEKERKEAIKSRIDRFDRSKSGGEAKLNFASRPEGADNEALTMSGKLLKRRLMAKDEILGKKLPQHFNHNMGAVTPPPPLVREGETKINNNEHIEMGKFQNL